MKLWFFIWSRRLIRILRPKTPFRKKISDADIIYTWYWPVDEVAALFGIASNTVYQRRSKIKRKEMEAYREQRNRLNDGPCIAMPVETTN